MILKFLASLQSHPLLQSNDRVIQIGHTDSFGRVVVDAIRYQSLSIGGLRVNVLDQEQE
jgi:hypothetical protein